MAKISIPVEAGNRAIGNGTIGKLMQGVRDQWHPESMYFTTFDGRRTAFVVFDMANSAVLPPFAEPFFQELEADVQLSPVMTGDDLQQGLSQLS